MSETTEQAAAREPVTLPTNDCTVCRHPDAAAVDEALLSGTPIRAIAGTFGLARSSIARHKQNHLTLQTITDPDDAEPRPLIQIVDVRRQLTDLVDRLEKVVELATRTRKAPAAVSAMRELRQALEAIAKIQADPQLQSAAVAGRLSSLLDDRTGKALGDMIDFILQQFFDGYAHKSARGDRDLAVGEVVMNCLRSMSGRAEFNGAAIDTSAAKAFVEQQALDRAARVEAEVQRRVAEELKNREARSKPLLEARPIRQIEPARESSWIS